MMASWNNLAWLAAFGPYIIMTSLFMIIAPMFIEVESDGSNKIEGDEVREVQGSPVLVWISFVAHMGAPSWFMFAQFFEFFI